jgi:hypothetical protein
MRILVKKEFEDLAVEQGHSPNLGGFIDNNTYEPIVLKGESTRTKLHELGHEKLEHLPRSLKFYGKMEPWTQSVDDEIEAEIYSYRLMNKKLTPKVGMGALKELLSKGWEPSKALSLVIGRLRNFGIKTSWEARMEMVRILEKGWEVSFEGYEDF